MDGRLFMAYQHMTELVLFEDRIEDRVRNLVGHLVGVAFGDGFRGKEKVVRHLNKLLCSGIWGVALTPKEIWRTL